MLFAGDDNAACFAGSAPAKSNKAATACAVIINNTFLRIIMTVAPEAKSALASLLRLRILAHHFLNAGAQVLENDDGGVSSRTSRN